MNTTKSNYRVLRRTEELNSVLERGARARRRARRWWPTVSPCSSAHNNKWSLISEPPINQWSVIANQRLFEILVFKLRKCSLAQVVWVVSGYSHDYVLRILRDQQDRVAAAWVPSRSHYSGYASIRWSPPPRVPAAPQTPSGCRHRLRRRSRSWPQVISLAEVSLR